MPEEAVAPPNPYGPSQARLASAQGEHIVRAGTTLRVGRDPVQCSIVLSEPRVSGLHATVRFQEGQLWVKDEGSNNGTFIDGLRVQGEWLPVPSGSQLRFGPAEFQVHVS